MVWSLSKHNLPYSCHRVPSSETKTNREGKLIMPFLEIMSKIPWSVASTPYKHSWRDLWPSSYVICWRPCRSIKVGDNMGVPVTVFNHQDNECTSLQRPVDHHSKGDLRIFCPFQDLWNDTSRLSTFLRHWGDWERGTAMSGAMFPLIKTN
jgi:hypothetical protein